MKCATALRQCFVVLIASLSSAAMARDLDRAPPAFNYQGGLAVPVDFQSVEIDYVFDVATSRATGHAVVTFDADAAGYPILDLVPTPTVVKLNDVKLAIEDFPVVSLPSNAAKARVLGRAVDAGSRNVLEIDFTLGSNVVSFGSGRVRSGFFMSDLATSGREFFEQYGPANYEFDQVAYKFNVRVTGTQTPHAIFTNGAITETATGQWTIDFPDYFTTSSIYFHLNEVNRFQVQSYVFEGLEATIPVTVYSDSASRVQNAVTNSKRVMTELESTYGAFAHEKLVIYVTSGGGGMEYGGATMTESSALGHELTHSWFARGVMPSNANSGWIDEAIASWRDDGYPRASRGPNRSAVNLGGFSPYRRNTTMAAYSEGAQLISEFDYLFASKGGMKPVLRSLFTEMKRQTITVDYFKRFLEGASEQDLTSIFNRYVFGRSSVNGIETVAPEAVFSHDAGKGGMRTHHPRPYTPAELALYR